jgi:hypothetical protein
MTKAKTILWRSQVCSMTSLLIQPSDSAGFCGTSEQTGQSCWGHPVLRLLAQRGFISVDNDRLVLTDAAESVIGSLNNPAERLIDEIGKIQRERSQLR